MVKADGPFIGSLPVARTQDFKLEIGGIFTLVTARYVVRGAGSE